MRFFSKYQASYAVFIVQRHQNNNGNFMSMAIVNGVIQKVVVIPAGKNGEG